MISRKKFLSWTAGAYLGSLMPWSCRQRKSIGGSIIGASSQVGHKLLSQISGSPVEEQRVNIVIIGGGVSGLSAGYFLQKGGENNFVLLDLEDEAGGNARCGSNQLSAFPWGAHYVPLPNNDLAEYLEFLTSINVITGSNEAGLPMYNEAYLCFDPSERLYINGRWQEGLVPHFGVPENEVKQIAQFLEAMHHFRQAKGSDGKDAFAIPIDNSSTDSQYINLDTLTMKNWLLSRGWTSSYLHQYVKYCCRDDFGTRHEEISAWMGIHYFAARKGRSGNAEHDDVLTWPEGNGFLVNKMIEKMRPQIKTGCLATRVQLESAGLVHVDYYDVKTSSLKRLIADQCLLATPQFVTARLLQDQIRVADVQKYFDYTPWVVANFSVRSIAERSGAPPAWDNVIHNSESLGYVCASHQLLQQHPKRENLTFYLPLTNGRGSEQRKIAQARTHSQWTAMVIDELKKIHPDIDDCIEKMDIMIWGHAMAKPLPGLIKGSTRAELSKPIENRIFFAHTDLAGASIFEEGFYQGLKISQQLLTQKNA